ncbi:unnamed protein product [Cylicostephanus goldi]|uniref:Uncharacterized protein n=1 Tax=Cylicostephanus goldi TaxID=71465 RepID=A0A3P7NJ76_CYLGO|nr:unnamed protein product [Cylicostephanus goldi]
MLAKYNIPYTEGMFTVTAQNLQQMLARYNIAYTEGMFSVTAQNVGGKVAIVVKVPQVDCNLVPIMASEVKKSASMVTSATAQCGNGAATYV